MGKADGEAVHYRIQDDVLDEVRRQEGIWDKNEKRADQPPSLWLTVLTEEVGEVAEEVCEIWDAKEYDSKQLREELIQVAAVAASWIEAIDSIDDESAEKKR